MTSHVTHTKIVASLVLLYFACLPHPIVPPKYYITAMRCGAVSHARVRATQLRILVHKLPGVCRNIVVRLLTWLRASMLPPEMLAGLFARYMIRPTNAHLPDGTSPPAHAVRVVQRMIEQAEFIGLATDEPVLSPEEAAQPLPAPGSAGDCRLEAVAMFDFAGGEGQIDFICGERIQLLNAFQDDWLEGQVRGIVGFLPASFVDLIPLTQTATSAAAQ
jgi:hypothetical protein